MKSSGRAATLRDVAAVAGVSASTASRVLNGGAQSVSEALSLRVLAVADSLGYVSNQAARALRGSRTAVFFLVSDPRTAAVAAMAAGMELEARDRGVMVSMMAAGSDLATTRSVLDVLHGLRPRALVVASAAFAGVTDDTVIPDLEELQAGGCNVVYIGEHDTGFPSIRFDDFEIGRTMGRYMGGLGRQRPAIISTPGHPALINRLSGFRKGLGECGVADDAIIVEYCELTRDGGYRAALRLADRNEPPDLVLAGNDLLAIGALSGFRQAGLEVPDDVAVSGVDDIPLARDVIPSLTTTALPFLEAGRLALIMALDADESAVHLPGELIVRASTQV